MQRLTNLLLIVVFAWSAASVYGDSRLHNVTVGQAETQNAPSEEQHAQASSNTAVQTVTGCLVRSGNGYSLMTDTEALPIETSNDLSKYVNKRIKVTGILEHHSGAAPSATSGAVTITDLRLRLVASVIGDCNQVSK